MALLFIAVNATNEKARVCSLGLHELLTPWADLAHFQCFPWSHILPVLGVLMVFTLSG